MITVQKFIKDNLNSGVPTTEITSAIFNKSKDEKTQIRKSYLEENTKNSSLLAREVSGGQATNLINKQIRSK